MRWSKYNVKREVDKPRDMSARVIREALSRDRSNIAIAPRIKSHPWRYVAVNWGHQWRIVMLGCMRFLTAVIIIQEFLSLFWSSETRSWLDFGQSLQPGSRKGSSALTFPSSSTASRERSTPQAIADKFIKGTDMPKSPLSVECTVGSSVLFLSLIHIWRCRRRG